MKNISNKLKLMPFVFSSLFSPTEILACSTTVEMIAGLDTVLSPDGKVILIEEVPSRSSQSAERLFFSVTGEQCAGLPIVISIDGKRIVMGQAQRIDEKSSLLREIHKLMKKGHVPCGIFVLPIRNFFRFIYSKEDARLPLIEDFMSEGNVGSLCVDRYIDIIAHLFPSFLLILFFSLLLVM